MSSRESRVRLAYLGMHPSRRRDLEERLGASGLVEAVLDGRIEVPDTARVAVEVAAGRRLAELADGTRLVLDGDSDYPASLAELPDRPDALFVRGALPEAAAVAVVGSRGVTRYGQRWTALLAEAVASAGIPIVSGLAKGVDGIAHRSALVVGTPTVAVLGCGIDRWYPAGHARLGEEILAAGGAIVSEYAPGTPPAKYRFPLRNRIVSGLADAVIVTEAAVRSGALITARTAVEQGREVLALPGDLDRATSEGTNRLIADGAVPVTSVDDALEAVGRILGMSVEPAPAHPLADLLGNGVTLDDLPALVGKEAPETLALVGRWELEGLAAVTAGVVVPR